jgi:hypothetical protein
LFWRIHLQTFLNCFLILCIFFVTKTKIILIKLSLIIVIHIRINLRIIVRSNCWLIFFVSIFLLSRYYWDFIFIVILISCIFRNFRGIFYVFITILISYSILIGKIVLYFCCWLIDHCLFFCEIRIVFYRCFFLSIARIFNLIFICWLNNCSRINWISTICSRWYFNMIWI